MIAHRLPPRSLAPLLLILPILMLALTSTVTGMDNWYSDYSLYAPTGMSTDYNDIRVGNFFGDRLDALAVLEGTTLWLMPNTVYYGGDGEAGTGIDPEGTYLHLPVNLTVKSMDSVSWGATSGRSDGLFVVGPAGLHYVYYKHEAIPANSSIQVDSIESALGFWQDADLVHVGDMNGDGTPDVVGINWQATTTKVRITTDTGSGWTQLAEYTLTGKVTDCVSVDFNTTSGRELVVVRDAEGLDVLNLNGTPAQPGYPHFSSAAYPDHVARLERFGGGTDLVLWVTNTGNGPTDQVVYTFGQNFTTQMDYLGTAYVESIDTFDRDNDGDMDVILNNASSHPYILLNLSSVNQGSDVFFVDAFGTFLEGVKIGTLHPNPLEIGACLVPSDIDSDGDQDLMWVLDEGLEGRIHHFVNTTRIPSELGFEIEAVSWDTADYDEGLQRYTDEMALTLSFTDEDGNYSDFNEIQVLGFSQPEFGGNVDPTPRTDDVYLDINKAKFSTPATFRLELDATNGYEAIYTLIFRAVKRDTISGKIVKVGPFSVDYFVTSLVNLPGNPAPGTTQTVPIIYLESRVTHNMPDPPGAGSIGGGTNISPTDPPPNTGGTTAP